jgi:F-type H+-transporting ATPase subunit gamma
MASTQQIKSRIKSIKNTKQITKAMELVAASRMRKAQEVVGRSRLFAHAAQELLTRLSQLVNVNQYDLYRVRPIKSRLLIVITSDRGLAGAYNSNLLRSYISELKKDETAKIRSSTICIGRKGANLASRLKEVEVVGAYHGFPDNPHANDLRPIVSTAIDMFVSGQVDAVDVLYTKYNSSLNQEASSLRILPAGFRETELSSDVKLATFEPSVDVVLENATRRLVEVQLLQGLLESVASEHSMRMMAMKNASDNATDLVDDYTLAYNNARQAKITQELAEITGGSEALQ